MQYLAERLRFVNIKAIYSMGYFDDIQAATESGPAGKTVIFKVKEKPTIRVVNIKGNTVYDDEDIKENIDIRTGSILNVFKLNSNVKRIEDLYKDKNYHNVNVSYNINQLDHNQADLEFIVEEGYVFTDYLARYRMPSMKHIPQEIKTIIVEDSTRDGHYGAKGVGEISTMPTPPAIINAIYNACGVRLNRIPVDQDSLARELRKSEK
jgi:hypothetical protein